MTAHKHAELIKAKADNMNLVVFCKDSYDDANKWQETSQMPFQEEFEYFLCLPQHKEACLHWLNGGLVEWTREEENGERWFGKEKYTSIAGWNATNGWMLDDNIYRIKPRKEKRWIGVHIGSHQATPPIGTYKLCSDYVLRHGNLIGSPFCEWKFIEIEVEV